nr:RES family NAD+ phosphorylase [Bradyrhizobium sp. WSM1417]
MIPSTYQLLRIAVPDDFVLEAVGPELPPDWRSQAMVSREIGDRWLDRSATGLVQVPSAISAHGANFLLNPAHSDAARVSVAEVIQAPFDPRLLV